LRQTAESFSRLFAGFMPHLREIDLFRACSSQ
jgi:hypothetical protein